MTSDSDEPHDLERPRGFLCAGTLPSFEYGARFGTDSIEFCAAQKAWSMKRTPTNKMKMRYIELAGI
jgi:hypothetical protein